MTKVKVKQLQWEITGYLRATAVWESIPRGYKIHTDHPEPYYFVPESIYGNDADDLEDAMAKCNAHNEPRILNMLEIT